MVWPFVYQYVTEEDKEAVLLSCEVPVCFGMKGCNEEYNHLNQNLMVSNMVLDSFNSFCAIGLVLKCMQISQFSGLYKRLQL